MRSANVTAREGVDAATLRLKLALCRRRLSPVMVRSLLHVLLALTLALNGISAPWAMARMNHAAGEEHAAHAHATPSAASAEAAVAAHHGAHGDHRMAVLESDPSPSEPPMDGSCCSDANCHCGCVLPPVVPLMALALKPQGVSVTPFVFPAQPVAARRSSPPFRPPAV